jgi:hypothetical protein
MWNFFVDKNTKMALVWGLDGNVRFVEQKRRAKMKNNPVDIVLSEKLWWEELGHQDLPFDLICLLRDLIDNINERTPVLASQELKKMAKKELNYIIIGSDTFVIDTRRYLEEKYLFFLSPI